MIEYEELLRETRAFRTLAADKRAGSLNHCYLFLTEDTAALDGLIRLAARTVLCGADGCGVCNDCLRVEHGNHSAMQVCADTKSDAVRAWMEWSFYAPNEGDYQVMILPRVDLVDARTQNLLLKTLEEPTRGVVFLLGAAQASAVLDTVKSRAKKQFVQTFSGETLAGILEDRVRDPQQIDHIVACSAGSIARAIALAQDAQFGQYYRSIADVLRDMETSKQVVDMLSKLQLTEQAMTCYLDIAEMMLRAVMRVHAGECSEQQEIRTLAKQYNLATVVNVLALIAKCRRKLIRHCKPDAVADSLLMGILEVKYQCR